MEREREKRERERVWIFSWFSGFLYFTHQYSCPNPVLFMILHLSSIPFVFVIIETVNDFNYFDQVTCQRLLERSYAFFRDFRALYQKRAQVLNKHWVLETCMTCLEKLHQHNHDTKDTLYITVVKQFPLTINQFLFFFFFKN